MQLANSNQFDPARRGYHAVYREGHVNHCPACGRTHWYIGRQSAECGFCHTAIPLSSSWDAERATIETRGRGGGSVQ